MSYSKLIRGVSDQFSLLKADKEKLLTCYDTIIAKLKIEKLADEDFLELANNYNEIAKYIKDPNEQLAGNFTVQNGELKPEDKQKRPRLENFWIVGIIAGAIEVANMTFRLKYPDQWPMNSAVLVMFLPLVALIIPYILPYLTGLRKMIQEDKKVSTKLLAEAQTMLSDLQYSIQMIGGGKILNLAAEDEKVGKNLKLIEHLPNDLITEIRNRLAANAQEMLTKTGAQYEIQIMARNVLTKDMVSMGEGKQS